MWQQGSPSRKISVASWTIRSVLWVASQVYSSAVRPVRRVIVCRASTILEMDEGGSGMKERVDVRLGYCG